jgi:hypothetical protein
MDRIVFTLFILFFGSVLNAQDVTNPDLSSPRDSVRAYYIQQFPDYFFVYPLLKQRSLNFELEKLEDNETVVAFKPNNTYSFGVGLYVFELNVELTLAVPLAEKSISRFGKSAARDFQLNVLGKKWGVDAYYQKYNGFYVTDSNTEIPDDSPFPQRADIISRNVSLTGNYVFNNQKFSFRSAYNFAERQLFSKGSLLLFSSLSSFKLEADSSIISTEQQVALGEDVSFKNLNYTSFSLAPGYTYSIVFNGFFLNGTFSVGPAHHWIGFQREGDSKEKATALNSFVAARIGIGYNGERVFGGISFVSQGSNVKFEDVRFSNSNGSFKILLGYRFGEFGVLKKRVWDLIPFRI